MKYRDFIFLKDNDTQDWFYNKYIDKLGTYAYDRGRWPTMKAALNLYLQRDGKLILETGCQREPDDWGAGASTTIFQEVINRYDQGRLISVDNNHIHLERAASYIGNDPRVSLVYSDSVAFLLGFSEQIDLLYLDSYDYPIVEIIEPYGGIANRETALETLNRMSEKQVLDAHNDLLEASQKHCEKEILAALPHLSSKSIVLIDDNSLPGGGKPRLTREILLDNKWEIILDYQQTLWIKQ